MRNNDPGDFSALVERHRPRLLAVAFAILGDRVEAEDVAQEALLRGFLALASLRRPDRVGSWLAAIAGNLARMRLRRPRLESVSLERLAPSEPTWLDLPAEELEAPVQEVREALASLPAPAREVLVAHYVEGLSCAELAERLGLTSGAVRVRLHRARAQLRELLPAFTPTKEKTMIEVTLEDVWVRMSGGEPPRLADERLRIVLLREQEGARVLPIWIGPAEGDSLTVQLRGGTTPRPLTPDLTARLLEAAGARIERVVVTSLEDKTFYAVVAVAAGGDVREVDARPSDALNLALRVGAPVFVDEAVLEQAGIAGGDLPSELDERCEEVAAAGFFDPPPPGTWKPHSLELVTAYGQPLGK